MLWETHDPLNPLPPLSLEDRRLIAAFLDANQDVFELAEHSQQDLFDLVQKLSDPVIKAWLAALTALTNASRRERALHTLDAALTNTADAPTLRRCASRLLRHFEMTRPRRQTRTLENGDTLTTSQTQNQSCPNTASEHQNPPNITSQPDSQLDNAGPERVFARTSGSAHESAAHAREPSHTQQLHERPASDDLQTQDATRTQSAIDCFSLPSKPFSPLCASCLCGESSSRTTPAQHFCTPLTALVSPPASALSQVVTNTSVHPQAAQTSAQADHWAADLSQALSRAP